MRLGNSHVWLTVVGSLTLGILIAWGLAWRIDPVVIEPPRSDVAPVVSHTIDLVGSYQGQRRWRLLAKEAAVQGSQQIFDAGAKGFFYGGRSEKGGDPLLGDIEELSWQAEHAVYNASEELLTLTQKVKLSSPKGDRLITEKMLVRPGEKIDFPQAFTLSNPQVVLTGQSGAFWVDASRLLANHGRITLRSGSDPNIVSDSTTSVVITADRLQYDRTEQIAYGQGNLVIEQPGLRIQAPQGSYNRQQAHSTLSGGVKLRDRRELGTLIAQAQPKPAPGSPQPGDEVMITADQLQYDRITQIAQGQGNLVIDQGTTSIAAPQGSYKRRNSQSILLGGVTLTEPGRLLKAERLNGNHKDKIFLFEDQVTYSQKGDPQATTGSTAELRRADTQVTAQKLLYNSPTETANFSGQVEFVQKGRKAKAELATISPERITLSGKVVLEQIQGDWLAQRSQDPDVQAALRRPTLIFAERVEIDQKTNDARFFDDVVVVQANRAAEGDTATYTDKTQILQLSADNTPVLLCDKGDIETSTAASAPSLASLPGRDALDFTCRGANQIRSKLITLDMDKNTFAATGQSSMQFRVNSDQPL